MSTLSDFITPTGLPAEDLIAINNLTQKNAYKISFYSEKYLEATRNLDRVSLKVISDLILELTKEQSLLFKFQNELEEKLYQL